MRRCIGLVFVLLCGVVLGDGPGLPVAALAAPAEFDGKAAYTTPKDPAVGLAGSSLQLTQTGFGQVDEAVGYAFSVWNVNQLQAASQVKYRVVAYNQGGTALAQTEGFIAAINREQFAIVGGTLTLPPGQIATQVQVELDPGRLVSPQALPPVFAPTEMSITGRGQLSLTEAVGTIKNHYPVETVNVRVSAVVYDFNDAIIGGGAVMIDTIPANGEVAVAVPLTFDQTATVGRVRLFPCATNPTPVNRPAVASPPLVAASVAFETEPNDSQGTANFVPLGFDEGEDDHFFINGASLVSAIPITPVPEDDGDINKATNIGLTPGRSGAINTSGYIGDGPYGNSSGDNDFYRVDAQAGQTIYVSTSTAAPFDYYSLDTMVDLWAQDGSLLAYDDNSGAGYNSRLTFTAPVTGRYYIAVYGYYTFLNDPFDSASGSGYGYFAPWQMGDYDLVIGLDVTDSDFFSFDLAAGDVLGVNGANGLSGLSLWTPDGSELIGSAQDLSYIYPQASPLAGAGSIGAAAVIATPGRYALLVDGLGNYEIEAKLFRAKLEAQPPPAQQILYIDFDGAVLDPSIFGSYPDRVTLAPLSSFLPGWGLSEADENTVIDAIMATVVENFNDVRLGNNGDRDVSGQAGEFDIEILNSRDDVMPIGQPNVSRVIVGGSMYELGIYTIGIAQSIDPGNFETKETAVVLLDVLSAGAADPDSLNQYGLGGGATKVDLIGVGVGNIVTHEAGHFFGNFHTDQFNSVPNLMDQGGNLDNMVGVGPDRIFGTSDDVDVDFGEDVYVPNEGLTGTEDSLNTVAFGLSTGTGLGPTGPLDTITYLPVVLKQ